MLVPSLRELRRGVVCAPDRDLTSKELLVPSLRERLQHHVTHVVLLLTSKESMVPSLGGAQLRHVAGEIRHIALGILNCRAAYLSSRETVSDKT